MQPLTLRTGNGVAGADPVEATALAQTTEPAKRPAPDLQPLRIGAADAARLFSVGLRTWRTWDALGKVPRPARIGARVLWDYRELIEWSAAGMPDRERWELLRAQQNGRH